MRRDRRLASWIGAIVGIGLALALNAAVARGAEDKNVVTQEFHQTYPLTASGRIDLSNINGSVHITAWDQNQVKVDAIKRASDEQELKDMEIRVDAHSDSLSIETKYQNREHGWYHHGHAAEVEYTLTVPRNARLDEIKLINGGLDISGVNGEVRASCINGKLKAEGLAARTELKTINGPLEASYEQLKAGTIELSSVNGPVLLTLPSDTQARIEATTVHGGIDNNFGLHTDNHRWVGHELHGELGSGGAEIRLRNVNGPVEIRHEEDGKTVSPARDTGNHSGSDDI